MNNRIITALLRLVFLEPLSTSQISPHLVISTIQDWYFVEKENEAVQTHGKQGSWWEPEPRSNPESTVVHIRQPKYWSFSVSPSNEYSELTSFRVDWFDLLAVQGTLKGLLQHNSKVSILQHSAFFIVQLSHPYVTTGKTTAFLLSLKYQNSNLPYRFSTFTTDQREKGLKVAHCFTTTSCKRSGGRTDE